MTDCYRIAMQHEQLLPSADLTKYVGQWIVISGNKVIAHDKDLTKLNEDIQKCKPTPIIAKIPKKEVLIF